MKKSISLLATMAFLALTLPLTASAATGPCAGAPQVYDLKADWSGGQNPNGTWSYRQGASLLVNDPFAWLGESPTYIKTATETLECHSEVGDVLVFPGVGANVLWTAPENGTIDISGSIWPSALFETGWTSWTLSHNAIVLSSGDDQCGSGGNCGGCSGYGDRTAQTDFSLGSGGAAALQNIRVAAGDQLVLQFGGVVEIPTGRETGVNFTITLTPDSGNNLFAADAIIWHQPLARNGASEDTDPSAGRTIKYRFKRGSTIPVQIHALGCDGADVTANASVIGQVTVFGDSNCDGAADANAEPIEFNGVGGGGGVMDKVGGHLKYNLDTTSLPTTTQCYILRVTVTDTSTGEEKFEEVLLQAK